MTKDYYDILGVSKSSTDDEIKKAYRKLAHLHHPDKSGGDEAKFKEANEAYQVLSDKAKRQQYDQFGQTFDGNGGQGAGGFGGFSSQGGPASGWDFSGFSAQGGPTEGWDFGEGGFEDIFSGIFGGNARTSRRRPRGQDIQVDLEISFEEMVKGVEKKINLYKSVTCEHCNGEGGEPGSNRKTCSTCKGEGRIQTTRRSFFGNFSQVTECPECQGEGKIFEKKCRECGGDGKVKKEKEVGVKVPAGISNGQTLSLEMEGEAGSKGSIPGNLYVNIRVSKHQKFSRRGNDILSKEFIPFSLLVLGGKTEIDTISGKVVLKIPTGTQSGDTFRLKGEGVPDLHSRSAGNHLIEVIVETPKKISREQKKLLEELQNQGM